MAPDQHKKVFGCPCYKTNGKVFAFLVTNGIMITDLPKQREKRYLANINPLLFMLARKSFRIG